MKRNRQRISWAATVFSRPIPRGLALLGLTSGWLWFGSGLSNTQAAVTTNPAPALQPITPIPSAPAKSPVQFFRHLLAMTPEERQEALAIKPPPQRSIILAKINEYEEMPDMVRELRLRLLQLRIYLLPLMKMAAAEREKHLAAIPEKDRPAVQMRLQDWDRLSPPEQEQILQNESSLHYFLFRRSGNPALEQEALAQIMPQKRSQQLEQAVQNWRAMSEAKRREVILRWNDLFSMNPSKQQEMLRDLPNETRPLVSQMLQRLNAFSPEEQVHWLDGLKKFASLSPEERLRFILHAKHWQKMTADERNLWRSIVSRRRMAPTPTGASDLPNPMGSTTAPSRP